MNKHCRKVLKYIATSETDTSFEAISSLHCEAMAVLTLKYLEDCDFITRVDTAAEINNPDNVVHGDWWIVTMKGLDKLEEFRSEKIKYWIPIIISNIVAVVALFISIFKN